MAKALHVCFRDSRIGARPELLERFARALTLDPLSRPTDWSCDSGSWTVVTSPCEAVQRRGASFALGLVAGDGEDALRVGEATPDGTFALVRVGNGCVDAISDYTASRSLWYYHDERVFAVSTSQRLLATVLGDVDVNPAAARWMLTTGTLGPGVAWDRRVRLLAANSKLHFDTRNWQLTRSEGATLAFRPRTEDVTRQRENLEDALSQTLRRLRLSSGQWTLALSGGMDSRSLLFHLNEGSASFDCVTWGVESSLLEPDTDAAIARRLAELCGRPHRYAVTDLGSCVFSETFERFVRAGEGRVDHLSGYLDGMRLWSELASKGRAVLRGYDALGGTIPSYSTFQARFSASLLVSDDLRGVELPEQLRVSMSDVPETLWRRADESLAQWRDRLWLVHRTPAVTAALDEIKNAYVELANPLLFRSIVDVIRGLPDEQRTGKKLFAKIVQRMFPDVPFARRASVRSVEDALAEPDAQRFLSRSLRDRLGVSHLPSDFLRLQLGAQSSTVDHRARLVRTALAAYRQRSPPAIRRVLRRLRHSVGLDRRRLALRTLLVERTIEVLRNDAVLGRRALAAPP